MFSISRTVRLFVLMTLLVLLAGCQDRETKNPFLKEKGTYNGKADETLNDDTRQQLRRRMIIQRGGGV